MDNAVTAFRRLVEDLVPWYDRELEQRAEQRNRERLREGEAVRTEARRVLRQWLRR